MVALTILVRVHLSVVYATEIAGAGLHKTFFAGKIARKFMGLM